jgi:hypothetical protein
MHIYVCIYREMHILIYENICFIILEGNISDLKDILDTLYMYIYIDAYIYVYRCVYIHT